MENLLLLVAGTYLLRQTRRPVRRAIGRYGGSFTAPSNFHPQKVSTSSGDQLYHGAFWKGRQLHGIIHFDLAQSLPPDEAALLLENYLVSVQRSFKVVANTGPDVHTSGLLHTVTDFWQDESGIDWKVKGYTDGRNMSLLYVRNLAAGRCVSEDAYLDSLSLDPLR